MQQDRFARIALSIPSLLLGLAIAGFAIYSNYLVLFARPPGCDMMCPLLGLPPTVTTVVWSIWCIAWCVPAWPTLDRRTRVLAVGSLVASMASFVMLYIAF
jgi:hypothetical protein